MKKQRGFIFLETSHLCMVGFVGWGIGRTVEWLWPFVKAIIHSATS